MLHLKLVRGFLHARQTDDVFIGMPMYDLIEYSDNYSDTTESLWQFEKDEPLVGNADLAVNNNGVIISKSFKYKTALLGNQ